MALDALEIVISQHRRYLETGDKNTGAVTATGHSAGCFSAVVASSEAQLMRDFGIQDSIKFKYCVSAGIVTGHMVGADSYEIYAKLVDKDFISRWRLAKYEAVARTMGKVSGRPTAMDMAVARKVFSPHIHDGAHNENCVSVLTDTASGSPIYVRGLTAKEDVMATIESGISAPVVGGPLKPRSDGMITDPFPMRQAAADGVEAMVFFLNQHPKAIVETYKAELGSYTAYLKRDSAECARTYETMVGGLGQLFREAMEGEVKSSDGARSMKVTLIHPEQNAAIPPNLVWGDKGKAQLFVGYNLGIIAMNHALQHLIEPQERVEWLRRKNPTSYLTAQAA
jgi:hypothetical protein